MKLENVDVSKLQVEDLPKFDKCPCELCDDGCFDRAGNKHHPECRRQLQKRSKLSLGARCPLSHYQGTFLAATSASGESIDRRRHPCLPPPDNDILPVSKRMPMSVISSQKDHYQPPPTGVLKQNAVKPTKQTDNILLARAVPMETHTHYQTEYVEKPVVPQSLRSLKGPVKNSQVKITDPNAPIASQTTTRADFKSWHSAPSQPYTEMPAVAGLVLFPGSNRAFDTTSGSNFIPYGNVIQTKPVIRLDLNGNLKTSGSMDLRTNYRQEYISHDIPTKQTAPTTANQQVYTRRPMNGISQTSFDFRAYPKHRPAVAADMEPFLSQIKIGNAFTAVEKDSQYRLDYPGHDTNQHPRQPAFAPKDNQNAYASPITKMESVTSTQRDYPPIDIASLPRLRAVPLKSNISINDQKGPMESVTMSRYHYQPYEPSSSQRRYGEFISTVYIPPLDKFQGTTTTGDAYQGRAGQPARACNPEIQMSHPSGKHDHNTSYRTEYRPHGVNLCAAKAYAIAQNQQNTNTPVSV